VILRGNGRQDIFLANDDRYRFYFFLQEGIERYRHVVHAFCLMTNHVHLLVQVDDVPLSRIMQNISFRYTRWFNWKHGKSGHLFQGRFKAVVVDSDEYLIELVRYLHLNPVKAGLAKDPQDYPWSSHRCYVGKEDISWVTTDLTLSSFGMRKNVSRKKFHLFVMEGVDEGYRPEFHGLASKDSRMLGDESFMESALAHNEETPVRAVDLDELVAAICRYYQISTEELKGRMHHYSHARAMAAWIALETTGCTMTELAKAVDRDVSTLSSRAKRLQLGAREDARLLAEWNAIRGEIAKVQA
jgi:putative transposase